MQQYRVNYSLLVGLVVGTLIFAVAVFGLWRWQIGRKSGWLIAEADSAYSAGNYREAVRYYSQYLSIRGRDEETHLKFAKACADLSEQDDVTGDELNLAWRTLETLASSALAERPEAQELQQQLVEMLGRFGRVQDALDHLGYMLDRDPTNPKLQALRANYMVRAGNIDEALTYCYKLVGYDADSEAFDADSASAPNEVSVYVNLASILAGRQNKPELAERVMDRMIEVNPESAEAYLARSRHRNSTDDTDGARADIRKAHELAPEDADVLLAVIAQAINDEQHETAADHLAQGKELYPNDPRFYRAAAAVAIEQNDFDAAWTQIDEGLEAIPGPKGHDLLYFKADLQYRTNDLKGLRETIDDMTRSGGFPAELIEWFEIHALLAEQKWFRASEALNRLKPKLAAGAGPLSTQIDFYLGVCYEQLGHADLAQDHYQLVLDRDPEHAGAKAGRDRSIARKGLPTDGPADPLQEMIANELSKPENERNWKPIDEAVQTLAEERQLDEPTRKLLQAQLLWSRQDFNGAARALAEADKLAPNNLNIQRAMVQLLRMHPERGPAQAMQRWQKVVDEFGDQAALRIDKADILIAMHADNQDKEELRAELAHLLSGVDSWNDNEKVQLWGVMAQRYLQLGILDEARQYAALSAQLQPNNLPLRLSLFALAYEANDEAGMKDAQSRILEIVGSENHSDWLYTEARRKYWQVRAGQLGTEALDDIRRLVARALEQRRDWHELHVLNGELELAAGNAALALRHFDRAQQLGRPAPPATATHIRLLFAFGRFADAGKLLDRLPDATRYTLLGQLYPEILFRTNRVADAIQLARTAVENDPDSPQKHFWYGQLLARSAQDPELSEQRRGDILKQALGQFRKAVELQPDLADGWFALIQLQVSARNLPEAERVLREAQLAISGDHLPMFLARSYEVIGRWFDAEMMYRAVYEAAPDELPRAQQLAAFYLGPIYQLPDRQLKALPLINKILRAGSEGKLPAGDPTLLWARRMGASMLAATGDYQNLRKAANLLTSNAQDGVLSIDDKLELAQILAPRPEPESRNLAIQLLEEVARVQPLNEPAEIVLGELYFRVGRDWMVYRQQMRKAIARFPESARARESYVRRLLDRGDQRSLQEAAENVNRIRQLAPNHPVTLELTARLAKKLGRQQQVLAELQRRLPDLSAIEQLDQQQVQMASFFANVLVDLGDIDNAERIYRDLAAREPSMVPALAIFLGLHRDVEHCFAKLNEVYSTERIPETVQVALSVVRQRRDSVGDKYDDQVQRWLDAGLRENPGSIVLLMAQADFYDIQKRYDQAADVYRKLLDRSDLTGARRAVVLNNLAFLVALKDSSEADLEHAAKLVQEAIQILGPNADILDTRAVVRIARKEYRQAIHDLELSVTDTPTASKYFHKAHAHLLAQENRAAVEAWEKAEELGLNHDAINLMEHDLYEELKTKIEQIRGATVTRAEPLRRAG